MAADAAWGKHVIVPGDQDDLRADGALPVFALGVQTSQLGYARKIALHDLRQIEVLIGHVDRQHATVRQVPRIEPQGLYGQQVYRYGVRRKSIDEEVVKGCFRLAGKRQAGIAHYEFGIRLADAEIAEQRPVGRDPYDLGVDFEEA